MAGRENVKEGGYSGINNLEQVAAVEGEIGGENIKVTEEDIVSLSLKMLTGFNDEINAFELALNCFIVM